MGDTSDPDDEPPADAYYTCAGSYLRIDAGDGGPVVARLRAEDQTTADARDAEGHVQLRGFTTQPRAWDADAGRFSEPTP